MKIIKYSQLKRAIEVRFAIGPFWIVGNTAIGKVFDISSSEWECGTKLVGSLHMDSWKTVLQKNPSLKGNEYNSFPRGRVSYLANNFTIEYPDNIDFSEYLRNEVLKLFRLRDLDPLKLIWISDSNLRAVV